MVEAAMTWRDRAGSCLFREWIFVIFSRQNVETDPVRLVKEKNVSRTKEVPASLYLYAIDKMLLKDGKITHY